MLYSVLVVVIQITLWHHFSICSQQETRLWKADCITTSLRNVHPLSGPGIWLRFHQQLLSRLTILNCIIRKGIFSTACSCNLSDHDATCFNTYVIKMSIHRARSHVSSRYTTPAKQVLGTQVFRLRALWNVFGTPSFRFKIGTHLSLHSMTYCVHCATCEVILTCTLRADSGLRDKPSPVRTSSRFHIVQTAFRRHTKGVICSENMVWPCSSWNCSSRNTIL